MKDLPILYVCRVRDTTRRWRVKRAMEKAAKLGWLPIDPLDMWSKDDGEERLQAVRASIAAVSDAVLVVGEETTKDMQAQIESYERFGWNHIPVYGTHSPDERVGGHPERRVLAAPPFFSEWTEAARHVEGLSGWSCATCRQFFGDAPHAERMARWHCVKEIPCEKCGAKTNKTWSHCIACREVGAIERYEKLKKAVCPPDIPVYSDRDNEWYDNEDDAWSAAEERARSEIVYAGQPERDPTDDEVREQLREMRLKLAEPQHVDEIDLCRMTEDLLPDDSDGGERVFDKLEEEIGEQVAALNEAIQNSSPLSYTDTDVAVDVDATWPTREPASTSVLPPAGSPLNAIGENEGMEYGD